MVKTVVLSLILFAMAPVVLADPVLDGSLVKFTGPTMGTTYVVKYRASENTPAPEAVQKKIDEILVAVNQSMSTYIPTSEISRFNRAPGGEPQVISRGFAEVVEFALDLAAATTGVFDPTIGPLLELYQMGYKAEASPARPSPEQLARARGLVDFRKINLSQNDGQYHLSKTLGDVELDLSAVAKGYGVDLVLEYLVALGVDSALVEIGGEIRTMGRRPDGRHWQVAIEQPSGLSRTPLLVFGLDQQAIATSGNYRNFRMVAGNRVGHVFNGMLGDYLESPVASVSVVADNCMEADGWATALLAMGKEAGIKRANTSGLKAVFVILENNHLRLIESQAFQAYRRKLAAAKTP